ncbi:unnamed protein product, partial [marine sediment metagenome]
SVNSVFNLDFLINKNYRNNIKNKKIINRENFLITLLKEENFD